MSSDRIRPPAIWKKAASTTIIPTNRNGTNEEEIASSAKIPNPSSATTSTTNRIRSPRKMKTQIAKLTYNPSITTKSNKEVVVNEKEKPVVVVEAQDFQKKRQDRDREVKEIHEMLNEITKTPTKQKQETEEEPQKCLTFTKKSPTKKLTNTFQRSKTETNLRRPTARKCHISQESQTARSKSAQIEEKNSPPKQRQKAYNSEEAQRYMLEQKKKRRSLQTNLQGSNSKAAINKDDIKKRLENLRQNTRKIVDKNVKIAKKKAEAVIDKPISRKKELRNGLDNETEVVAKAVKVEASPEKTSCAQSPRRDEIKNVVPNEPEMPPKASQIEAWPESTRVSEKQKDLSPLSENYKKVGLLRKPEFKDHSFSAIKDINMDKENLIIDNLTPQISGHPTSRFKEMIKEQENLVADMQMSQILEYPTSVLKEPTKEQTQTSCNIELEQKPSESSLFVKSLKRKSSTELDLKVPEAKLRSRTSLKEKSVQVDPSIVGLPKPHQKNTDLPYWLKPTSVQTYPYNFIMAVRKKLEAIANPPALASSSSSSTDHQVAKKIPTETPVSYPKYNRNNNVKRRIINNENRSLVKSVEESASNKENIDDPRLSKSFSEVTSNFSSISIHMPDTQNTISSIKPKPLLVEEKKNLRFDEDDTTVSSSIFSSPEKKKAIYGKPKTSQPEALSPLSTDNISNLHIKSKSMMSNITLGRGDSFVDTSSHRLIETGSISHRSDNNSVDFSQLLDDFNRSLSQVIEVNQQLKTTLVKSQIFSPERKKSVVLTTDRVELAEYVSDFEESSNVEEKEEPKESNRTETSRSIPEVHTTSKQSSEINTEKSFSASSTHEEVPEEEELSQSSSEEIQSQGLSPESLGTQTFTVSSEEQGKTSTRTRTVHEEAIEESPNKENMSGNQYSLDSLEISHQDEYIKSHINTSRGDYKCERSELSAGPPPSYKVSSESQRHSPPNFMNSSVDSEFLRVFNKSDMEISVLSLNRSLSESTVNYSSIGMYEKLIQNETNKSDHLAALLKMREKALIDRTKGQIAWLEVQKERYKAKGLILQISAIKKKQRGILLKMEKEREEIKKLLQQAKVQRDNNKLRIPEIRPCSDVTLLQQRRAGIQSTAALQQKQHYNITRTKSFSAIVKGYELETSRSLEQLLQKREEDLRRRREHVERLMEWHRRLDQEEAEVLQLEKILLDYNNVHEQQQQHQEQQENVVVHDRNPNKTKMEKKLKEIDRSLRELSSISGADGSTDAGGSSGEFVRTTGVKLNKLWRRLTSQRIEKFQPNKRYKLCKSDIEQIYEDAKLAVLHDFGENTGQMEMFLGQTSIISTPQPSNLSMEIPQLNLNFSSGQSEEDMMRGNYSPSAAEEEFIVPSTSSRDVLSDASSSKNSGMSRNASASVLHSMLANDCSSSSSSKIVEKYSSQKVFQNIENEELASSLPSGRSTKANDNPENIETVSSDLEANSRFSVNSKIDNYNLLSSTSSSNKNSHQINDLEESRLFEFSTKNESPPNIVSNSKTQNDCIESSQRVNQKQSESCTSNNQAASSESLTNTNIDYDRSTLSNVNKNTETSIDSFPEVSQTSTNAGSSKTNSQIKTVASSFSDNTKTKDSNFIDTESLQQISSIENICTKSNPLKYVSNSNSNKKFERTSASPNSIEESVINTEVSDRTDGSITSLIEGVSKTANRSADSSDHRSENLSDKKTPTESNSIKSQTIRSSFNTKSNSTPDNTPVSNLAAKSNTATTISETESRSLMKTKSEIAKINNQVTNTDNIVQKLIPSRSSEENAAVSILESLLNSTYISNSTLISDHACKTVSDIQAQLNSNVRSLGNWQESQKDESASLKDDQSVVTLISGTNSLSYPEETTLRSIKSIENSTNSKHSVDHVLNPATTSKAESTSDQIHCENVSSQDPTSEGIPQSYSSAFEDTVSSNQIRSSVIISANLPTSNNEVNSEPLTNVFYESDFTEDEETNIDDLSLPKFETTGEEDQFNESHLLSAENTTDFEKRLIDLDVSLKDLDATFEKALSPEKTPSPPRDDGGKKNQQQNDSALMPDIISEAELRRRHQAMLENELKQFEHAVPYMYVREIPNKPPPPYVPPAHGSPMTTIFPSEERIKDITFRRTKELYFEILNIDTKDENGKKPPSVLDENITNIYERIILDICKEYLTDYKPILASADPNNFHSPLAFFNPPDRLRCMQDFIYKEVRKSLAMDKNTQRKKQLYSVYGHRGKRDHIGEIIIQDMFDEDDIWSNFYIEEEEVLELIIDEIVDNTIKDIACEVLEVPRDSIVPMANEEESVETSCNNST